MIRKVIHDPLFLSGKSEKAIEKAIEKQINSNSDNPRVGKEFQVEVRKWFEDNKVRQFNLEHPILIGCPAKPHKFDIADTEESIVVECKCFSWTGSGNIPSAKLAVLNEALFYFSFLPAKTEKMLVMSYATHPKKTETLAEYYYRTHKHLLGDVKIMEYNMHTDFMRIITQE